MLRRARVAAWSRRSERRRRPDAVCRGTILSREQYLADIECWGYRDARRLPEGTMTTAEIARWTAAIEEK